MTYTVYVLKDQDGKVYVGVTSMSVKDRWNNGNGYRFIPELWEKIKSQGWDSVQKEIIATNLSGAAASELEIKLISKYDSANPDKGYNRELGGLTSSKRVSRESCRKMALAKTGESNPNFGKHFSETHRKRIADSNRGLKRTAETCEKNGVAHRKPVSQYSLSGAFIATYPSGKIAALETGVQAGHISKVCKHKRSTAGGFVWAYA